MRTSIILITLILLTGCDSLGEIIREKKYTVNINETPNSRQEFGYNSDHDYVGFMMHGKFGKAPPKHEHFLNCEHDTENKSK